MSKAAPRDHLDAIGAAQAAASAANAARAAAYHLLPPGVSAKIDWKGCEGPGFNATPRQQALLDVVQDLFDGGETNPPLVAVKVACRLRCTQADILRSRDNVDAEGESGFFYDDFLHAMLALRAQEAEQSINGLLDRLVQPAYFRGRDGASPAAEGAPDYR